MTPVAVIFYNLRGEIIQAIESSMQILIQYEAKKKELEELDKRQLSDETMISKARVATETLELECSMCLDGITAKLQILEHAKEELTMELVTNLFKVAGFEDDRSASLADDVVQLLSSTLKRIQDKVQSERVFLQQRKVSNRPTENSDGIPGTRPPVLPPS